jgi:hypothetical protein
LDGRWITFCSFLHGFDQLIWTGSLETAIAATHGSPVGVAPRHYRTNREGNESTTYLDAAGVGVLGKGGDGRTETNRSMAATAADAWEDVGVGRQSTWRRGRGRHGKDDMVNGVSRGSLLQRFRYELIRCSPADL